MLPCLLAPGPLPIHHTISGAGLLAKGIITQRLWAGRVVWGHPVMVGFSHSGFTLKFWGDKWRVRATDWGQGRVWGCWGSAEGPITEVTVPAITWDFWGKAAARFTLGFPMALKRMEGHLRHCKEWFDLPRPCSQNEIEWRKTGGSRPFLGRTSGWLWASHFLPSCSVSSPTDWRGWAVGPLKSFLSQTSCDSDILCKPVELTWDVFLTLQRQLWALWAQAGALLWVVFKAWLPLVLKIHLSKIFLATFDVLNLQGARNSAQNNPLCTKCQERNI